MIRPVILAEYHQVKGPIVFLTLLLLFAASVLRLACGVVGAIVAMILLLFPLIQSVGVGPFEGEYAKGTFRFLNALPVNRGGIWLVKSVCGLLMALLCTSCLCIPLLGFPDATMGEVYALLRQIGVPLGSIGLLLGAWLLFGQAAGMLSVMMCTSRVTAQLLQLAVGYLPAGAFYLWFMVSRTLPSPQGVTLGLVTGAAVCFAGSFVLFVIRNPFLEQKWLWRGVGSGFIVLATAAMAASGLAMVLWPAAAPAGRFDRVVGAHASPDGRGIVVGTQAPMLQVHSYVLTAEGKLKFDLGGKVGLLHREKTWCQAYDRTIVAYAEADL